MNKMELAKLVAKIYWADQWDMADCKALCQEVGMKEAWENSTGETFENVMETAIDKAGIRDISFGTKTYHLYEDAEITGRVFHNNFNHADVSDGEEFMFEMAAHAIGEDGNEYNVYWVFVDIKGENEKELDAFDYDNVNRVEEV